MLIWEVMARDRKRHVPAWMVEAFRIGVLAGGEPRYEPAQALPL